MYNLELVGSFAYVKVLQCGEIYVLGIIEHMAVFSRTESPPLMTMYVPPPLIGVRSYQQIIP